MTGLKKGSDVNSRSVAHYGSIDAGVDVVNHNIGIRQGSSLRVGEGAGDSSGSRRLSERHTTHQHECQSKRSIGERFDHTDLLELVTNLRKIANTPPGDEA